MPGFHIEHFGCRAARADGEAIRDRLGSAGLGACHPSQADLVVVNTCSVTAEADRSARAFIRKTHRDNPSARIVVTGCYAQRAPEELARMPGVAAVVGNSHKALAPQILLGLASPNPPAPDLVPLSTILSPGAAPIWADELFAHSFLEESQVSPGVQTRPNLKIQEGCGNRCSFCVIPMTRGSSRSLPRAAILSQVRGFVAAGGKELVLSGINLGRWGADLRGVCLPDRDRLASLVRSIVEETALPRLRLSSIEPMDWDDDLIGLLGEFGASRIALHAHLPLQSGSDSVLRRMHRRYRPWHYSEKVAKLVSAAGPGLTLGADVMVGFPAESDAEFEETLAFVRAQPFGYLHLFPFSPRPGTPAERWHRDAPVQPAAVEERLSALRALAAEKALAHRTSFLGRDLDAITLHTPPTMAHAGRTAALTGNFLPVVLDGLHPANQLIRVRVAAVNAERELVAVQVP